MSFRTETRGAGCPQILRPAAQARALFFPSPNSGSWKRLLACGHSPAAPHGPQVEFGGPRPPLYPSLVPWSQPAFCAAPGVVLGSMLLPTPHPAALDQHPGVGRRPTLMLPGACLSPDPAVIIILAVLGHCHQQDPEVLSKSKRRDPAACSAPPPMTESPSKPHTEADAELPLSGGRWSLQHSDPEPQRCPGLLGLSCPLEGERRPSCAGRMWAQHGPKSCWVLG